VSERVAPADHAHVDARGIQLHHQLGEAVVAAGNDDTVTVAAHEGRAGLGEQRPVRSIDPVRRLHQCAAPLILRREHQPAAAGDDPVVARSHPHHPLVPRQRPVDVHIVNPGSAGQVLEVPRRRYDRRVTSGASARRHPRRVTAPPYSSLDRSRAPERPGSTTAQQPTASSSSSYVGVSVAVGS